MSANRSWMYRDIGKKSKHAEEYLRGVKEFLEFAFSHRECVADGMIRCPSNKCEFLNYESKETVQMCLLRYGFVPNYELWTRHGESHVESDDDMVDVEEEGNQTWAKEMIAEAAGPDFQPFNENPNTNSKKFYDMYNAADEPLWKGCDTYSTLTADEYANKLREKHGFAPDESVIGIEDPGLEIWQECVGGVTRGRLIGRPGERWSKTGVSKDYNTHIESQEHSKKLERLEKDKAKLYKIVNSQSSYISEQGSYISEMSRYMQEISEKFGIPAPPHFTVRPPPMPLTNDGASADAASGVPDGPDGPSSARGCDDFDTEDNGDNDDESESSDD